MCYSSQIEADYRRYRSLWGADIALEDFARLWLRQRREPAKFRAPPALGQAFAGAVAPAERAVHEAFLAAQADELGRQQADRAAQQARLDAAAAKLAGPRPTKKAAEDQRIATRRLQAIDRRIAELRAGAAGPEAGRIYPGWYAPVLVSEGGRRVLRPMRYRCRPFHVDAAFDTEKPGTYNARRDSLEGFWRRLFGHHHAVAVIERFYEVVEHAGRSQVLAFRPADGQPMLVACLWSPWSDGQESLESFAMITGEPTPEVVAAGHDRLVQQIRPEDLDAWLNPDPKDLQALYDILDRGPRPYYEARPVEAAA